MAKTIIDMAKVMTAFADRHPQQAKRKSSRIQKGPDVGSWVHNEYVVERRDGDAARAGEQIVRRWVGDAVRPGMIYDWLLIEETAVGLRGTYQIESNDYSKGNTFQTLTPMLRMAFRYFTSDMVGVVNSCTFESRGGQDMSDGPTQRTWEVVIYDMLMLDVGGDIGRRWVVDIAPPDHVLVPGAMPDEHNYFDLGPAEEVYDPEFGQIAYEHRNVLGDPGVGTIEFYGNLERYDIAPGVFWAVGLCMSGLGPGQGIGHGFSGGTILSFDRRFMLTLPADGNLLLGWAVPPGGVLWASGTPGHPGSFLRMQDDGNLVLGSVASGVTWSSGTHGNPGAFLHVQDDGNLVVYSRSWGVLWQAGTGG